MIRSKGLPIRRAMVEESGRPSEFCGTVLVRRLAIVEHEKELGVTANLFPLAPYPYPPSWDVFAYDGDGSAYVRHCDSTLFLHQLTDALMHYLGRVQVDYVQGPYYQPPRGIRPGFFSDTPGEFRSPFAGEDWERIPAASPCEISLWAGRKIPKPTSSISDLLVQTRATGHARHFSQVPLPPELEPPPIQELAIRSVTWPYWPYQTQLQNGKPQVYVLPLKDHEETFEKSAK